MQTCDCQWNGQNTFHVLKYSGGQETEKPFDEKNGKIIYATVCRRKIYKEQ